MNSIAIYFLHRAKIKTGRLSTLNGMQMDAEINTLVIDFQEFFEGSSSKNILLNHCSNSKMI